MTDQSPMLTEKAVGDVMKASRITGYEAGLAVRAFLAAQDRAVLHQAVYDAIDAASGRRLPHFDLDLQAEAVLDALLGDSV